MSEDKRTQRTKRELRKTVLTLIQESPFEKITVKEICRVTQVSRLTFYAYYRDKYDLMNDIFQDFKEKILRDCHELNLKNNPERDLTKICCNLLDCVIETFYSYGGLTAHINYEDNPYVKFAFHTFVRNCTEQLIAERLEHAPPKYPLKPSVAFLCSGFSSFLGEYYQTGSSKEEVKEKSKQLLTELLHRDIFFTQT